ncbi:MAG: SGNH/GDSL hydrolase family protein [Candidatus Lernaella stagnicola]|nr:SGNH/GDSL hydrolase family protein [Candidatus Lernaella stagnicola]
MPRRLRRLAIAALITVLVIAALATALLAAVSFRFPQAAGMVTLGLFQGLPEGLRDWPPTWKLARGWMSMLRRDDPPPDLRSFQARGARVDYLVVALGDSTTAGVMIPPDTAWPHLFEQALRPRIEGEVRVVNAGNPGEIAPDGRRRLARDVLSLKPQLVIIGYLINDGRIFHVDAQNRPRVMVDEADFLAALTEMFAALQEADVPTMVFTCHPIHAGIFGFHAKIWPELQAEEFARRLDGLRRAAERFGVVVVDTYPAVAAYPHGATLYLADGMHMGVAGHRLMSELIYAKWNETIRPGEGLGR